MSLREVIPTNFADLLNLFGISLQGQKDNTFVLTGDVVPTVLIGSTTQIQSISTPMTLDAPFTAGPLAGGVAANTVHADTGQLPAGIYAITIMMGFDANAGNVSTWLVQRRNAANAANIWEQQIAMNIGSHDSLLTFVARFQDLERLRVLNKFINPFTSQQVSIWTQRLGD